MASDVLFDRNCCSTSAGTLKAASSTPGDSAFHTEVLPAKWVNTGLQCPPQEQIMSPIENKVDLVRGLH